MSLRLAIIVLVVATAALGFFAMKRGSSTPEPTAAEAPQAVMPAPPHTDAGLAWNAPARWEGGEASGMRLATYHVPAAKGGDAAECAVYYFGPGQGGGVDANLQRWIGEFEEPGTHNVATREVRGMKVSQLEVTGKYRAHAMGTGATDMMEHDDWALLGAVVEGPNGDLFFKLTGPATTVKNASKEFDAMLGSLEAK